MDIILECPTHLSSPTILRCDGKVYVYPENCRSRQLDLNEYDPKNENLTVVQTNPPPLGLVNVRPAEPLAAV